MNVQNVDAIRLEALERALGFAQRGIAVARTEMTIEPPAWRAAPPA